MVGVGHRGGGGGGVQAKDIADADFLAAVERHSTDGKYGTPTRWVMRGELTEDFPEVPPKVLLAKARTLIKQGKMYGCPCGCRGDFRLEP
jgi:hypothetical protein